MKTWNNEEKQRKELFKFSVITTKKKNRSKELFCITNCYNGNIKCSHKDSNRKSEVNKMMGEEQRNSKLLDRTEEVSAQYKGDKFFNTPI